MWMGEGFVSEIQHNRGREDTMDDVGHRYLRELVQRCMVLVGKMGSLGKIKTCRMHDLMRDFCVSKAQEENFLHINNILSLKLCEVQNNKVRRLAVILESDENYIEGVKFNEYPYLRSLLYLLPYRSYSYFKESCFKKFKLVRVLHLKNFQKHSRKLPKDIGCLIHLRYLSLRNSNINKVSSSIGNLRCLETLDLRIFSKPRVPNVFKYMKQLKHLYLPCSYRVCCKLELGNLNYLQTLVNVRPKTIQIPTWFKFNLLQVLKVRNKKGAQDAIQMLISRCPLIEKLHLYGHLKKLPEAHQFSPNLAKLTLSGTKLEEDPMETLKKLPNLKILCFRQAFEKISKYESVGRASFNGKNMVCSKGGFPLLQYLFLGTLYYLEEWRVEEGAMPSLCRLEIEFCSRLKMIPDGLRFIATLQELKIIDMPKPFIDSLNEGGPDFDKVKHVHSLVLKSFCQRMIIVSS
ncbi:putative disease resistance protein At1g59780 [Quercus lobata]|uniref:putative disease resistance protein At1g59780 n=1 Tax=Quercus lobata TaxID=97700 RepID=UPI001246384F|nr:putative disease resistance protein At1g59780 [Quercus lobata]